MSIRECDRCTGKTKAGERCRNRTCRGKKCWQHAIKEDGLRVKKSEIPGAGMGLFTAKRFKAGEKIGNYTGEKLSRTQVHKRYPGNVTAPYVLCNGTGPQAPCVDGRKSNSSLTRFINDSRGTNKKNNAKFFKNGFGMKVMGKPIPKGKEIYASYGYSYWNP